MGKWAAPWRGVKSVMETTGTGRGRSLRRQPRTAVRAAQPARWVGARGHRADGSSARTGPGRGRCERSPLNARDADETAPRGEETSQRPVTRALASVPAGGLGDKQVAALPLWLRISGSHPRCQEGVSFSRRTVTVEPACFQFLDGYCLPALVTKAGVSQGFQTHVNCFPLVCFKCI